MCIRDSFTPHRPSMSLSRSPSPQPSGGWSTPGLSSPRRHNSRSPKSYNNLNSGHQVTWASAQARSAHVNGSATKPSGYGLGFIGRHVRSISASLPTFNNYNGNDSDRYAEKEKLGRGRWIPGDSASLGGIVNRLARMVWRLRSRLFPVLALCFIILILLSSRE